MGRAFGATEDPGRGGETSGEESGETLEAS
jgi:hypothetical protein